MTRDIAASSGRLRAGERLALGLVLAVGAAPLLGPVVLTLHECLAGLCMTLALAGVWGWPRRWGWIMLPLAIGGQVIAALAVAAGYAALTLAAAVEALREKP